eukprot:GFUD01136666.1.p1 GENE.GFUD01136666.1~~GFUD01136666.1.p1  ORF type:complete len:742 (+),score=197.50 GFUD01136666.1:35-2260(+)
MSLSLEMAQPEESFKVCGLCSQLVDEAVKLTDILLDFLTSFLGVDGTNLPSKICTECYQGAIDSKKFKEKCLRTVQKLKKTHISSAMILGRSKLEVKQMKNKFKDGLDLVEDPESVAQIRTEKPVPISAKNKDIDTSIEAAFEGNGTARSRNSSLASSNDDTPLSTRSKKTTSVRGLSVSSHSDIYGAHMQPKIHISAADRKIADAKLIERSRSGRVLKRKVESPEDPVPLDFLKAKKAKTEPGPDTYPFRPGNTSKGKPKSKAPRGYKGYAIVEEQPDPKDSEVYDLDDGDEEIFPSLGPYQCEICQEITDTKQEFVAHIKALHKDMVDEAVLRSLESDLKKRKKKEMAASPEVKKTPKPSKRSVNGLPLQTPPPKITEKRQRPVKRYTEVESDDEYMPSRNKKINKKKSPAGKTELDPMLLKSKLEPATCQVCGTTLSRATDIPKHQESLKCRQAAFNLAQQRAKDQSVSQDVVKTVSETVMVEEVEVDEVEPVIGEKVEETDKNDVDDIANKVLNETFGNITNKEYSATAGPSDSEDVAQHVPNDTKFKASIAKRYEAERNDSSDSKETDSEMKVKDRKNADTDEYELEDDFDEEAAIKAAMQESIETAQKELGRGPVTISASSNKTSSPIVGDHSPAAYIDPAPQPDVEPYRDPNKSSVIVPNMSKHGITEKDWVDSCREPTTVDLGALGEPGVLPCQPPLAAQHGLDSLESQMAALHGAAGANTPWQEFNENYFGH